MDTRWRFGRRRWQTSRSHREGHPMPRNDAWEDIYEGVRFNHADEPLVVAIESARQQLRSERDGYRGALVGLLSLLGTGETYRIIRKHINQALKAGDATPPATPQPTCPFCGVVEPCRVHVVAPPGLPA